MGDRTGELSNRRDTMGVPDRLPIFLRLTAFSHIPHGPNEFDEFAGFVESRMTYDLDALNLSIGQQQSMLKIEILSMLPCTIYCLVHYSSILRVRSLQHEIHCRLLGTVTSEDAKRFL
jgi:hypothetical protein